MILIEEASEGSSMVLTKGKKQTNFISLIFHNHLYDMNL